MEQKKITEMTDEELTEMWIDDPESLKDLLGESDLSIDELADLYAEHRILQGDIVATTDPEQLCQAILKKLDEASALYSLTYDEDLSESEKRKAYDADTKKYRDALYEIEGYIYMQEQEYSDMEYGESNMTEELVELYERRRDIEGKIEALDKLEVEKLKSGFDGLSRYESDERRELTDELERIIEEIDDAREVTVYEIEEVAFGERKGIRDGAINEVTNQEEEKIQEGQTHDDE